ncbi:MAG: hypothetical protein LBQ51_04620, partial [Desulfovibrio sp.]|nr:hypothetical protein [Desulfovibrio sp.]
MHRIDGPGATADHKFTEGDPLVPIPPTQVTDKWLNAVQEELAGVVEGADMTLDKYDNTQLLDALGRLGTSTLLTLRRWGIMPWSDDINYYAGALCIGDDAQMYQALLASGPGGAGPKPVTNEAYWRNQGAPMKAYVDARLSTLEARLAEVDAYFYRKIGAPEYHCSTVLPPFCAWPNGDYIPFSDWPQFAEKYFAGGFEGMVLPYNANAETIAANLGKFRTAAADPLGMFLPADGDLFFRNWTTGLSREAGSFEPDKMRPITGAFSVGKAELGGWAT